MKSDFYCDRCGWVHLRANKDDMKKHMSYFHELNPLVKWSGGKKDEIKEFIEYIPRDYKLYIEPFVGGGSVFFHLSPKKAVINDIHTELIDFYKAIKDDKAADIYSFMEENPNNETTYYSIRDLDESPERFYYLRKTCYRGMLRYNKDGKFNIPFGKYNSINYSDLKNENYAKLLKNTEILNEDFEKIFEKYDSPDNFMFLDPPYDSKFTNYGYGSFSKEKHELLAKLFKKTKIRCLMVISKTKFIEDLYRDYIVKEYPKKYKFKIHSGRVGDEINASHLIIKNF